MKNEQNNKVLEQNFIKGFSALSESELREVSGGRTETKPFVRLEPNGGVSTGIRINK